MHAGSLGKTFRHPVHVVQFWFETEQLQRGIN